MREKYASFSYASRTSPLPLLNVFSEARALVSWTTTFFQSFRRFAWACLSVLPCFRQEPYAAMMFQRAPPDVNGLGVTISTPGRMRSFQVLIFFGLPSRTTKTTTEFVTMPLYDCFFHLASTLPAATSSSMSGASDSADDVGIEPGLHRARLLTGRAVGLREARRPSRPASSGTAG